MAHIKVYGGVHAHACSIAQAFQTLCNPMDCKLSNSSFHGISQARILEWVAMPSSRGSSRPREWTHVSCISCDTAGFLSAESPGKPCLHYTVVQYSCLENPMDWGAWWAAVHGVAGSQTWLSNFTFSFHFHALEQEMATHSSVLAWRIPGTGEPAGLPSMGSHRVRHDWSDLAAAAVV